MTKLMKVIPRKTIVTVWLAVVFTSSVQAATLLVDFNQINDQGASKTPDGAGNYWNTVNNANPTSLVDLSNGSTGVTLVVTLGEEGHEGYAGAGAGSSNPGPGSGLLNQSFAYTDGIFTNNVNAAGITLSFSGLAANTAYDFSLYAGRNTSANSALITLVTGSSLTGDAVVENRSLADFNITSDASGNLAFIFRHSTPATSGTSSVLTALSLSGVPEPSSALLAAIGLCTFLRRHRS